MNDQEVLHWFRGFQVCEPGTCQESLESLNLNQTAKTRARFVKRNPLQANSLSIDHAWGIIAAPTTSIDAIMPKARTARILSTILCLSICCGANGQGKQMYSWTDKDGVVHFTDQRPAGQEVTLIDIPESEQRSYEEPYQAADSVDEPSLAQKRRDDIAQKRAQRAADKAVNDAECAVRRAEIEQLEPNRRVYFTNEQGETERMDDVERTDRVAESRAFIQKNCG
jgi:hypothetical protein